MTARTPGVRAVALRVASARLTMLIAMMTVVALIIGAAWAVKAKPWREAVAYCALMPDSIGLYLGSHVTMRGIVVGEVTAIESAGTKVRVNFTVDADFPLSSTAAATTVSNTVVADRQLAVLPIAGPANTDTAETDAARADGAGSCLTKTLTPVSLSTTLDAVGRLARELTAPPKDATTARTQPLGDAIGAADRALSGTGDEINTLVRRLGAAIDSPDAAVGHLAETIDGLSSLSTSISNHWGDITSMLQRMGPVLTQVNDELFSETVVIIDGFARVLPMLNDLATLFSDSLLTALDATVPLIKLIGARVGTLRSLIGMTPALAQAFATAVDPETGRAGVVYRPQSAPLPASTVAALCGATGDRSPVSCRSGRTVDATAIARIVLSVAGAQ